MIPLNKMSHYFRLLLIVVCLFNPQLVLAGKPVPEKEALKGQNEIKAQISGENLVYVNIAFNDYVKNWGDYQKGILDDVKYYIFVVYEEDNSVIVEIQINQHLLKKDAGFMLKGGGGKYWFKGRTKIIQDKTFYK